jgi:UDP-glucose 4-epimerase
MTHCLLVGGAGFIGEAVVRALLNCGLRQVTVMGRSASPVRMLPPEVRYVAATNNTREAVLASLLDEADEVVDLAYATVPKTSFDDPVHDVLANLPFSVSLLKMASERTIKRFLLVSSGGTVYGNPQYLPLDEHHPTQPLSPYGITKLALENYGLMYHRLAGLPLTVVRPGNPYGPGQAGFMGQGFIGTAICAVHDGLPLTVFGPRGTVRDYIHVNDLADAIVAALTYGQAGAIYNAGTGIGHDNLQVLDYLRPLVLQAGLSLQISHAPGRPFDVAANVLSSARLTYETSWRPCTDLADGLRQTWEASCAMRSA